MLLTIIILCDHGWWNPGMTPYTILNMLCTGTYPTMLVPLRERRMRHVIERSGARVSTLKTTQVAIVESLILWMRGKLPTLFTLHNPMPMPPPPPPIMTNGCLIPGHDARC